MSYKIFVFQGYDQLANTGGGAYGGNTNLPLARPTQSSFPPTDGTRPSPTTVFISPTAGSYPTDTTSGDFSGSTFSSEVNPTRPDDSLYNLNNIKFPPTNPTTYRNPPQSTGIPHQQQPHPEISIKPTNDPKRPPSLSQQPQTPPHHNHRPVVTSHFDSDRPDVHHAYPIGPDPFPDYFPQPHPHYHFQLDHYDDKDSHFPGIYAQNAPSLHQPDRYYAHGDHFGLFPSGRYPDSGINLGGGHNSNYNANRKNGYQVTENAKDTHKMSMPVRPSKSE